MSYSQRRSIERGQRLSITYESKNFEVIVIDPNGLGKNQPSIGFGYQMMENASGLAQSTITDWFIHNQEGDFLKVPSGKLFKVTSVKGLDGNTYKVVEVSEWVALAADVLKNPKKVRKATKDKLIDFLSWFAVKGFYAEAYVVLKESYTEADSRSVSAWLRARLDGIARRNKYTKFLQDQGCEEWYEYANWTNYIYRALFGMDKKQMVETWELVEGRSDIGRNHIPEAQGLEAVAYCENQVRELFYHNLQQAHDDAIAFARRKFNLDFK